MALTQEYSGLILTNHAQEQLVKRGIKQKMVWETWNNPDHTMSGKKIGTDEFRKKFDSHTVTVIAKHNEKHEWVVVSCWIDPPLPGTKDAKEKQAYKNYQKAGFWKKMLLTVKNQLGI